MPLPVFDTLSISRKLTAAGFDLKQADALVESLAHAMDDTVATKADVAELKADMAELKASFTVMEGDLKRLSETAATKAEITGFASNVETEIPSLASKIETEFAGLKAQFTQGVEEFNKRLTRTAIGLVVMVSAVYALLELLP